MVHLPVVQASHKAEAIKRIQQLVPPGSPEPQNPQILTELTQLTADLIRAYQADGQLHEEPLKDVWQQSIHLYQTAVSNHIKGKVVLVTGGEGCVGSHLVKKLVDLGARQVVSVDKVRCSCDVKPFKEQKAAIAFYATDVRNYKALKHIFETEKPDIIFHLAAQRLPGVAEVQMRETVTTAICGTQNIIELCEHYKVQQCIFSSTGKASRYFTAEVYAASKKICEWQLAQAAQQGNVTYGMVRFTHMLNNSSVCQQIEAKIRQGKIVNIHAPHRYITAQNIDEALHLLLNSLVLSQPRKLKFLTVRHLVWPVETLELALYKIMRSGKSLPIYFQGLLPGYEEPYFLGQFDWSQPTQMNPLINVLENPHVEASQDMMNAEIAPFSHQVLTKHLAVIQLLTSNAEVPQAEIKSALRKAVIEIAESTFAQTSPEILLKILKWGTNPKQLKSDEVSVEQYQDILALLFQGLYGRLNKNCLLRVYTKPEVDTLLQLLSALPSMHQYIAYLRALAQSNVEDNSNLAAAYTSHQHKNLVN